MSFFTFLNTSHLPKNYETILVSLCFKYLTIKNNMLYQFGNGSNKNDAKSYFSSLLMLVLIDKELCYNFTYPKNNEIELYPILAPISRLLFPFH